MTKFLIIDGNSLGMRAACAGAKLNLVTKEGIPTSTIVCFFNIFNKILMQIQPTHIACCFDTDSNTFRKKIYPEYKANRHNREVQEGLDLNLVHKQFRFIRKLLKKLGIKTLNVQGYEGDDLCGTLAALSEADETYIASGDKDTWQLVTDNTYVIYPKNGFTDFHIITKSYIEDKLNISWKNFVGLKTLQGDVSDNIIGLKGCGVKTAARMLNEFGSSDKIAKLAVEDLTNYNKIIKNNLADWQYRYKLLKLLVTIRRDVDIPYIYDEFEISLLKWNDIKPILQDLEMYNFINRIGWGAVYRLRW